MEPKIQRVPRTGPGRWQRLAGGLGHSRGRAVRAAVLGAVPGGSECEEASQRGREQDEISEPSENDRTAVSLIEKMVRCWGLRNPEIVFELGSCSLLDRLAEASFPTLHTNRVRGGDNCVHGI